MNWSFFSLLLISVSFSHSTFAQQGTDPEFIFKTYLFLDKENVTSSSLPLQVTKSDSLFNVFMDVTKIEFEELPVSNSLPYFYSNRYHFYQLKQVSHSIDDVVKSRYFDVPICQSSPYVICINDNTGVSYRISGFKSSDFLSFLKQFKISYQETHGKRLSAANFLRKYKVNGIDFYCLYKGLRSTGSGYERYPCLNDCTQGGAIGNMSNAVIR